MTSPLPLRGSSPRSNTEEQVKPLREGVVNPEERDDTIPGVFALEDEPLPPLRRALLVASGVALAAGLFAALGAQVFSSLQGGFWTAVIVLCMLLGVAGTLAVAATRVQRPTSSAMWLASVALALCAVGSAAEWYLHAQGIETGIVFGPWVPLRWLQPTMLPLIASALAFLAWQRMLVPELREASVARLPTKVHRIERGIAKLVSVRDVQVGNTVLLTAGERLAFDGVIADGSAYIDESSVTGTLTPVSKVVGMHVFSGSTLRSGRVLILVKAIREDTMLSQLYSTKEDILEQALRTQTSRFVRVGIGVSVAFSLLGALYYWWLVPAVGVQSFVAATVGGALGATGGACIALIASILSARSVRIAVQNTGARVRTPHALEQVSEATTLVLERTGVLTNGGVRVEHVVSFKPYTQQQVLNTAAALELHSDHRYAAAIVAFARGMGAVGFQRVDDVSVDAHGVAAQLNGKRVLAGSPVFMRKQHIELPADAVEHSSDGKTVIAVAADGVVLGYIALLEPTRAESGTVVSTFQSHGVQVVLLTGEHEATARAHAAAVGITSVISDASAAVKDETYARLRSEGKRVIAVSTAVRRDVAVSIVVFAQRSTADTVAGADIIIRSDDLSILAHIIDAVAHERVVHARVTRAAWATGAIVALAAFIPFGGILAACVAPFGMRYARRA